MRRIHPRIYVLAASLCLLSTAPCAKKASTSLARWSKNTRRFSMTTSLVYKTWNRPFECFLGPSGIYIWKLCVRPAVAGTMSSVCRGLSTACISTSAMCAGIMGSCTRRLGCRSGPRGFDGFGRLWELCGGRWSCIDVLLSGILARQTYAWRLATNGKLQMGFWKREIGGR